jgi:hypothetical protein
VPEGTSRFPRGIEERKDPRMWPRYNGILFLGKILIEGYRGLKRWQRYSFNGYILFFILNLRFDFVDPSLLGFIWIPFGLIVLVLPPYLKIISSSDR